MDKALTGGIRRLLAIGERLNNRGARQQALVVARAQQLEKRCLRRMKKLEALERRTTDAHRAALIHQVYLDTVNDLGHVRAVLAMAEAEARKDPPAAPKGEPLAKSVLLISER